MEGIPTGDGIACFPFVQLPTFLKGQLGQWGQPLGRHRIRGWTPPLELIKTAELQEQQFRRDKLGLQPDLQLLIVIITSVAFYCALLVKCAFKCWLSLDLHNKPVKWVEWAYYSQFISEESEPQNIETIKLQRKDWNPGLLMAMVHVQSCTGVTSSPMDGRLVLIINPPRLINQTRGHKQEEMLLCYFRSQ